MITEEFADGIAFCKDGREIAFYSNIVDTVTFTIPPGCFISIEISVNDLEEIREQINLYKGIVNKNYD